jgi:antitoxin VapB
MPDLATTRVFRNGNSQAVRIPADFAFERSDMDVTIERVGDELRIRPVRASLAHALALFAAFSDDFMDGERDAGEQAERESL